MIRLKPKEKLKNWQNVSVEKFWEIDIFPFDNVNVLKPKFSELVELVMVLVEPVVLLKELTTEPLCAQLAPAANMEITMPKTKCCIFMTIVSLSVL